MQTPLRSLVRPWKLAISGLRNGLMRQIRLRALDRIPVPEATFIADSVRNAMRLDNSVACQSIEAERDRLLANDDLLVDGKLGAGGPFDGSQTVAAACRVSRSPTGGLLLYHLTRLLQARNVVELGTNVGISSAYLATALKSNGNGKLVTLEFSPYRQRIAQLMHERLALTNITYIRGHFQDTLGSALEEVDPVDLAFVDGDHQKQPTLDYFAAILKRIADRAVLVFDDIRWSVGMQQAWDIIRSHGQVRLAVNLHNIGLCVVQSQPDPSRSFQVGPIRM